MGWSKRSLSRQCAIWIFFIASFPAPVSSWASPLHMITTVREAHDLSSMEAARHLPIHLRAVVTYFCADPASTVVTLFVHDSTGSIYVALPFGIFKTLPPGTLVDLRGVSDPGEFAPIIAQPQIKILGFSGLPSDAHHPSLARLLTGGEDGQWVQVEGVVHSIFMIPDNLHVGLHLSMTDGDILVVLVKEAGVAYSQLVDATVQIRGNAGPLFDQSRRHMIGVRIQSPGLIALKILDPAPADPFTLPLIPINRLLQWDVASLLVHQVHVRGRVTLQWPGSSVCIRDDEQHGVCAQTTQHTKLQDGELVDLVGFASAENNAPVLTDATFRRTDSAADAPVVPIPVTAEKALYGETTSQLIQIDGQLISRDLASADTTLLLSSGNFIFTAILPKGMGGPATKSWKTGSILRITGICSVQIDAHKSGWETGTAVPKSFRVLMRSPADVVVLREPSWWTPVHAVMLLILALAATLGVLAWVVLLKKRIRESEQQFRHMALHDTLTGLASRLLLYDRLDVAVEMAKRHQTGLALLMVDLDKFKTINDTFGHDVGDEVLRVTARRLLEAVRKSDTVARIGGDEFIVLLSDLADAKTAKEIAASIVKNLAIRISSAGSTIPVSVSVGICMASADEVNAVTLLKNVDTALYCAKSQGRNRFEIFAPPQAIGQTEYSI